MVTGLVVTKIQGIDSAASTLPIPPMLNHSVDDVAGHDFAVEGEGSSFNGTNSKISSPWALLPRENNVDLFFYTAFFRCSGL